MTVDINYKATKIGASQDSLNTAILDVEVEGNWAEFQTGTDGVFWTLNSGSPITLVRHIYINGRRQRKSKFTITLSNGSVLPTFEVPADSEVDINWI